MSESKKTKKIKGEEDNHPSGLSPIRTIIHLDNYPSGQSSIRTIIHQDNSPWTFVHKVIYPTNPFLAFHGSMNHPSLNTGNKGDKIHLNHTEIP